jgi:hypothetical protein
MSTPIALFAVKGLPHFVRHTQAANAAPRIIQMIVDALII